MLLWAQALTAVDINKFLLPVQSVLSQCCVARGLGLQTVLDVQQLAARQCQWQQRQQLGRCSVVHPVSLLWAASQTCEASLCGAALGCRLDCWMEPGAQEYLCDAWYSSLRVYCVSQQLGQVFS